MRLTSMLPPVIGATLLFAGGAHAAVIYDNGGPNQGGIIYADASYTYTVAAEDFVLSAGTSTITDVHWWGGCSRFIGGPDCWTPNAFTLSFYNDSGQGSPGALIAAYSVGDANQTATGQTIGAVLALNEYAYSAMIADLVLTPGVQYWLGISDASTTPVWGWETTASSGDAQSYCSIPNCGSVGWQSDAAELAFNLTGPANAVPEPGTLALFGAGVVGLGALRRRRRSSDSARQLPCG